MSQIDDFLSGKPAGSQPVKQSEIDAFLGASDPGIGARVKQGASRALDSARTALTDDHQTIAKIAAEQAASALPQSELQRKMAEEFAPYVDAANKAEGVVDNVKAWGAAGVKRAGQLLSNPGEAAKMVAEQLPNSLPALAAGFAGAKAGAALGTAVAPGVGTAVGGVLGGIAGGFAGGYGLEKGAAMQEQVQKEAQARGIDIQKQDQVSAMVGEKLPEFESAAQRKGVGTAGTDAVLNVATMGLAGVGGRTLAKEARTLAEAVKTGTISAADASATLARLEATNAARNTLGAKALRGTGVVGAEMVGEGASEAVGQKLAYDKVDAGEVIDESLMGLGSGGAMALGSKAFNKAAGVVDQDATTQTLEAVRQGVDAMGQPLDVAPGQPPAPGPTLALPAPEQGVIAVGADGTARTPAYQAPGYVGDVTDVEAKAPSAQAGDFASILDTDSVYAGWSNVQDGTDRATMRDQMAYVGRTYGGKATPENAAEVAADLSQQFKWFRAASPEQRQAAVNALMAPVAPVNPVREQVAAAAERGGALSPAALVAIDTGVTDAMQPPVVEQAEPEPISLEEADARDQAAYEQFFASADAEPVVARYFENDDDIPDFDAASNVSEADFLRSLGATDEDIQDAIATSRQSISPQGSAAVDAGTQADEPAGPSESARADAAGQASQVAPRQPSNFSGTPAATMGQAGATASPGPGFGLKDALAQIRTRKQQEAGNAQATAPETAPATQTVPAARTGAVEAVGVDRTKLLASLDQPGATREQVIDVRLDDAQYRLNQAIAAPNINRLDQAARVEELNQEIASLTAVRDQARELDERDRRDGNTRFMLQGARQELDAAVRAGAMTPEAAQAIASDAKKTGNAADASEAIFNAVDSSVGATALAGPAPDIKAITAKLIPDMTDAELLVAIEHYGPEHKRTAKLQKEVQRRAAPAATTTQGSTNGPQADQAQQAATQSAQAGAAPAAEPATGDAGTPATAGTPEVRALTDGAPAENTGAQAAPAEGAQVTPVAAPEFTTVKTIDGGSVTVRTADLNGDKPKLRQYTKAGKAKAVPAIHRDNLDPAGEKRAAVATEDAANPLFNVITTKSGKPFAIQSAAERELKRLAMGTTHEVVRADAVQGGGRGFVIRRKESASQPEDMQPFAAETGTLGIPRAEMPQVPAQSHGALVKHLNAQGIEHETTMVEAADLKPTQAEYSPAKVAQAKEAAGDRAVIVSNDGHIIDGHHQALAAAEEGAQVKAIVLDAPVEQALEAVKNSPSAQPEPAAAPDPIKDAGEKIGGARKDRWKERGLNLDDLDAMTESEGAELATKANVWKPDYEAMSEASEPVTAAMVKIIYDQLAAKPKKNTPEGRRQYVQMMRIVRDVLTEANSPEAVRNAYQAIRQRAGLNTIEPQAKTAARELMFSVYKGRSDPFVLGGADLMKAKKMVQDGFPAKGAPWKTRLVVGREEGGPGTTERGVEIYMARSAEVGTPLTREQILDGFYRVVTKDNKAVAFAASKADAEAAAATVYERDMKGKKDGKPEPVRPSLDELKRENLPRRIDRDVKADDFVNDLGFRGIEFGNWSAQDERQRILNMAYDGLMDLAEIMGVPPKAMSLNGTLGMAFGARGGGRFAAHYEPGKLVINMTKIRGGGSMAHEWAHAMDHYFGELDKPDAYTTQARGASGWYSEDQYLGVPRKRMEKVGNEWKNVEKMRLDNLRPEMAAAFDGVMRALFSKQITKAEMVRSHELDLERTEALARNEQQPDLKAVYQNMVQNKQQALNEMRGDPEGTMYAGRGRSNYASQAQKLSGKSTDGYWVRPTEMFARAFESWVFDRVTAMGAKSDYLVHGVEEDRFAGGAYKGNPYPTGEERARINAAFDKLASTIKTRETDKGVAMFSRSQGTKSAYESRIDALFAGDTASRVGAKVLDRSDVLGLLGYPDQPVVLAEGKVRQGQDNHQRMTAEVWKKIPEWLDNPAAAFDSDTVPGRLVLIAPELVNGAPVRMILEPNTAVGGMQVHLLVNAFDAAGRTPWMRWAADGLTRYIDKKKFPEILAPSGLQLSRVEQASRGTAKILTDKQLSGYRRANSPSFDREAQAGLSPEQAVAALYAEGPAPTADSNARLVATQMLVDGLVQNWTRAPEIIVARNMQDRQIPQAVRDYDQTLKSQGATGEPRGFIYKGKVYLLSDELRGPQQIAEVLFHEALGHFGLRGAFGDGLKPILQQMGTMRRRDVVEKAREYGMVSKGMNDADTWAAMSAQDRLSAAEEVLAEMAQSTPEIGFVQRAIAAIRTWLRANVPGFKQLALTDAEIVRSYILPARGFVTRSSETPQQSLERALMAFSRDNDGKRAPSTTDFDTIANSVLPSNARSDTGDSQSVSSEAAIGQDPDDTRINFSRTTAAAKAVGDSLKSITVSNIKQRAGFKATDYLGLGLQALGRRQIVDIYGDMLPMTEYNRLVQQMEADKNEGGAEADQLVTRWAKLPDEGKLADLMHDATLAQIDPAKPYVEGDDKARYMSLQGRFKALSDGAQKAYIDTRDAYQSHHEKVRSAIKERIERSEIKGERKAALLKQMDDEFFKAVKGVYFPLARFGQYVVTVKGPDGKVESVSRAETMDEANSLRGSLLSAFPRDKGFTVGRVMLSKEFVAERDAVGRGFMTELYQVLDKQDMDAVQRAELEDTLGQLYLSSLPDLSWAKHGIHRKGTPGFSQDARRAYAQNMFHGARYLAKLRYSDLMQNELVAMQKHVDDWREVEGFDQPSAQRVVDEMNKRHETLMNPKSNALSTALTSFGFVFHLGLSPASAMVNLSQTALVAYPVMGAKWGYGKASAALLKASAEAAKGKNDITGSLNKDERAAYDEAVRAGTIDVTMAHDLAGIAQGEDAGVMWKIRPVMRWASFLFHHAERFNRQVTFVAAYRLAREAGTDQKAAFEQATKATYDGHFDYAAANRPRIMQGNVAKVVLLFKQYGQNMVYTLARNAQQAIKAETPEARAQARKTLGGLLATHAAAAGVLGLPMVTTLLAAASMIGGDDDEPWDAKVALQNMLADTFGQKPAEVMSRGLSRLTPWDISGRVGLDKLIFPDVQEGLEGQRLAESAMAAALGPVAGIGVNLLKGLQDMAQGQYARGLESMMPAALRGPIKSVRYEAEGVQDKTGIVVKDEVSAAGVVGQFLGFSPSEVRNATEGKSAIVQRDRALGERRQELLTKAARATMDKDAEARAEALKEIERFNEKNPGRRITAINVVQSVRNRQKRIDQAEDGVYLPRNRRDAMDAGRFANAD